MGPSDSDGNVIETNTAMGKRKRLENTKIFLDLQNEIFPVIITKSLIKTSRLTKSYQLIKTPNSIITLPCLISLYLMKNVIMGETS